MLQNFGCILLILFVIGNIICDLQWISQDFVIVLQNTPLPHCHPAMACLPNWCCWIVLTDDVIQHKFLQKWCHFTCLCAWASEGFFPGGGPSGFFKMFFKCWPKVVKFVFCHSKLRKQPFFAEIFKLLHHSDTHACV